MDIQEKRVEDKFICQQCEKHLAKEEALPVDFEEGAGEKIEVYICKDCFKDEAARKK